MKEVIAAIIGGFLAAATGWFLDRCREKERISKLKNLITTGIRDDLHHSISLYDKIKDSNLRKDIFRYYLQSAD